MDFFFTKVKDGLISIYLVRLGDIALKRNSSHIICTNGKFAGIGGEKAFNSSNKSELNQTSAMVACDLSPLGGRWEKVLNEGEKLRNVVQRCKYHCVGSSVKAIRSTDLPMDAVVLADELDDAVGDVIEVDDGRVSVQAHRMKLVTVLQRTKKADT